MMIVLFIVLFLKQTELRSIYLQVGTQQNKNQVLLPKVVEDLEILGVGSLVKIVLHSVLVKQVRVRALAGAADSAKHKEPSIFTALVAHDR